MRVYSVRELLSLEVPDPMLPLELLELPIEESELEPMLPELPEPMVPELPEPMVPELPMLPLRVVEFAPAIVAYSF